MPTSDDSVREIQLSGKQLVFLFMAVTVVSVVIFLCGVLVGRGVPSRTGLEAEAPVAAVDEPADPTAPGALPPDAPPAGPTAVPDLGYQDRLESPTPPAETLVAAGTAGTSAKPASAGAARGASAAAASDEAAAASAPAARTQTPPPAAADPAFAEPRGDGFAIQVAALRGRPEAEAVAGRLKAKGYAAFVLAALPGQPASFRVRVGKFKSRGEAEQVAAKLEREEQFKPWITR